MSDQHEQDANRVYYLASRVMSKRVFVETGLIAKVDHEYQRIIVIGDNNEEKTFRMCDYFTLVFPSYDEAKNFADTLPSVDQKVYHIKRENMITEETILYFDVPYIYFKSGDGTEVSKLGKTCFLTREQALNALVL
jgi:hypothetical protein